LDKAFHESGTERSTGDVKYTCPKCNHSKQKLEVNLKTYEFQCWVCGKDFRGGGIPNLLRKIKAPQSLINEAISIVGESKSRIKQENIEFLDLTDKQEKVIPLNLPDGYYFLKNKQTSRPYRMCYNYAKKRGFSEVEMIRYGMGYVVDGELKERLIIPSYDEHGVLNYYTARSYYDETFLKYINATTERKNVIGFEYFIDFKQPVNLVEGGLDAVTLGFNTIPLFGKIMSSKLKLKLVENKTPLVRVILDDDALKDALKITQDLHKLGVDAMLVKMEGKDPNKIGKFKTFEIIEKTKKLDFLDVLTYKMK
jgi:transcription elongation factor Elf1